MNSGQKRVGIYARVSTLEQTTDNQTQELTQYVSQRGWLLSGTYTDIGVSGAKQGRPELDRLMRDARKRLIDVVLVYRFDRFARSTTHLLSALDEFRTLGIDFISLHEAIDTTTPLGRMVFTVCASVAELERSIIVERVRSGIARARREGKHLGRPKVSIDLQSVQRMRGEGLSVRAIAKQMNVSHTTIFDMLKNLAS